MLEKRLVHAVKGTLADSIGARVAASRVRGLAHEWGLEIEPPRRQRHPRVLAPRSTEHPRSLSAREQQVLGHLAKGLNDAEIAAQLGVALRTAEHHVSAVLHKLGAANRTDAVRVARAQGLLPALPD